jgi:cell fate regulator YaaT (PSP1 superfamily)
MAKEQNFSLNSSKVSGACGRLLCCLRYEHETYEEAIRNTPSVGSIVKTSDGDGVVIETKPLASEIKVKFEGNDKESVKVFKCKEVKVLKHGHRNHNNDEPLDEDIPTD